MEGGNPRKEGSVIQKTNMAKRPIRDKELILSRTRFRKTLRGSSHQFQNREQMGAKINGLINLKHRRLPKGSKRVCNHKRISRDNMRRMQKGHKTPHNRLEGTRRKAIGPTTGG